MDKEIHMLNQAMLELQKSPNEGNREKTEAVQKRILQIRERIKGNAATQKEEW